MLNVYKLKKKIKKISFYSFSLLELNNNFGIKKLKNKKQNNYKIQNENQLLHNNVNTLNNANNVNNGLIVPIMYQSPTYEINRESLFFQAERNSDEITSEVNARFIYENNIKLLLNDYIDYLNAILHKKLTKFVSKNQLGHFKIKARKVLYFCKEKYFIKELKYNGNIEENHEHSVNDLTIEQIKKFLDLRIIDLLFNTNMQYGNMVHKNITNLKKIQKLKKYFPLIEKYWHDKKNKLKNKNDMIKGIADKLGKEIKILLESNNKIFTQFIKEKSKNINVINYYKKNNYYQNYIKSFPVNTYKLEDINNSNKKENSFKDNSENEIENKNEIEEKLGIKKYRKKHDKSYLDNIGAKIITAYKNFVKSYVNEQLDKHNINYQLNGFYNKKNKSKDDYRVFFKSKVYEIINCENKKKDSNKIGNHYIIEYINNCKNNLDHLCRFINLQNDYVYKCLFLNSTEKIVTTNSYKYFIDSISNDDTEYIEKVKMAAESLIARINTDKNFCIIKNKKNYNLYLSKLQKIIGNSKEKEKEKSIENNENKMDIDKDINFNTNTNANINIKVNANANQNLSSKKNNIINPSIVYEKSDKKIHENQSLFSNISNTIFKNNRIKNNIIITHNIIDKKSDNKNEIKKNLSNNCLNNNSNNNNTIYPNRLYEYSQNQNKNLFNNVLLDINKKNVYNNLSDYNFDFYYNNNIINSKNNKDNNIKENYIEEDMLCYDFGNNDNNNIINSNDYIFNFNKKDNNKINVVNNLNNIQSNKNNCIKEFICNYNELTNACREDLYEPNTNLCYDNYDTLSQNNDNSDIKYNINLYDKNLYGKNLDLLKYKRDSITIKDNENNNEKKYKVVGIPGDGNCFFYSLMCYLNAEEATKNIEYNDFGDEEYFCANRNLRYNGNEMRQGIYEYINKDTNCNIANSEKIKDMLNILNTKNAYVDYSTLEYIAKKFDMDIYIYIYSYSDIKNPTTYCMHYNQKGDCSVIEKSEFNEAEGCKLMLTVNNIGNSGEGLGHYELLIEQ